MSPLLAWVAVGAGALVVAFAALVVHVVRKSKRDTAGRQAARTRHPAGKARAVKLADEDAAWCDVQAILEPPVDKRPFTQVLNGITAVSYTAKEQADNAKEYAKLDGNKVGPGGVR